MTSFLLSADINEGGKFELTAPISRKEKRKKNPSILQYRILEESVWKIDGSEAAYRTLRKRKVRTYCEEERYEKCVTEVSSRIAKPTKTNCYFAYEVRMKWWSSEGKKVRSKIELFGICL